MSYQLRSIPFPKPLIGLAISQDDIEEEMFSVTCADKSVRVFSVASGREVMSKKAHDHSLNCLCMSNEAPGRTPVMVTSSRDNKVVMWNPLNAQIIRGLKLQVPEIRAMAIYLGPAESRGVIGATFLVLGSINGLISIWDMNSSKCYCILKDHKACIQALDVALITSSTEDGSDLEKIVIVSGSSDRTARTWDLVRGQAKVLFQTRHVVGAVAIAGRGFRSLVATAGADKNIRIWDEGTGILLHLMQGHLDAIFSLSFWFGHEILLVSAGADHSVRVWDILTGENVCTLLGHKDMVTGVAVATNPRPAVISSSIDCTVKVWDLDYILTLFYRNSFLCIPHSKGKRNDMSADNPKYHYQKKSRAELLAIKPPEQPKDTTPAAKATKDSDVKISKSSGTDNFEDMFEKDVAPVEEISGPSEVSSLRRQGSFTARIFGNQKSGRMNSFRKNNQKKRSVVGNFFHANAQNEASMKNEKEKAKVALSKKLAKKRGVEQAPESGDEADAGDSHTAEAMNVKAKHNADHARHRYSMDLKRADAADALRKRLELMSSKKQTATVTPDPAAEVDDDDEENEVDLSLRDPSEMEVNNDDYEALMGTYRDKFS